LYHVLSGFWLRMLFRTLSGLMIFTSFSVFRCGGPFAAVARSLQNLFRCRISFALNAAGLSKRRSWFFQLDLAVIQLVFCTVRQRPSPLFASIERTPEAMNERHLPLSSIPWIVTVPGSYGPPAQPPHHTSKSGHQRSSFSSSLL